MKRAWDFVNHLIQRNAVHRKGMAINDATAKTIIEHVNDELDELWASPNDIDELADVVAPLFHYAIKKGWSMEQLEERMIAKMTLRFTIPEATSEPTES